MTLPEYYILIDLEATTSDDASLPRAEMETIEIGAVKVNAQNFKIEKTFQCFVKPILHPTLHRFCTELTGITQAMLEQAPSFQAAIQKLYEEMDLPNDKVIWGSWGMFDLHLLLRDCALHKIPYLLPVEHINLKELFSKNQQLSKSCGMSQALMLCELPLDGAHHRALDDTLNIAKMMPWIMGKKQLKIKGFRQAARHYQG
jgi:3'-5' exoribonuclease 1